MRTLVLFFFVAFLTVCLLMPLIFFCWLTGLSHLLFFFSRFVLHLGQKIVGISLDLQGLDGIDRKSSYVFMANHVSIIDGPLLFMLIPHPVRVLMKKEAFRIPIISVAMRQVGFIPVDRKGFKRAKRSIDRASRLVREKGFSFLIFPEGTRSRNGLLQPFKRGGFFLAINGQVPIVPVSIKGTFDLMPRGSFFIKKGKVNVTFHKPIPVLGYKRNNLTELSGKVRSTIQSGLV